MNIEDYKVITTYKGIEIAYSESLGNYWAKIGNKNMHSNDIEIVKDCIDQKID